MFKEDRFQKILHKKMNNSMQKTAIFFVVLFLALLFNLTYIQFVEKKFLTEHALNKRNAEFNSSIPRGLIIDSNGVILAGRNHNMQNVYIRMYNADYENALAPVLGYVSTKYGKSGIELSFDADLSGRNGFWSAYGPIKHVMEGYAGNDLKLTIDAKLQKKIYGFLGNYKGAVVVCNAKTGALLALVSKPSYIPSLVEQYWEKLNNNQEAILLNRALQGLYPPGSAMKILIAEKALENKAVNKDERFLCDGQLKIGKDYTMTDDSHEVHGSINLAQALAVSCNVTFGKIALKMGEGKLKKAFEEAGFDSKLLKELPSEISRLPDFAKLSDGELAQIGIGQGSLLVTPMHLAMLVASIINKGVMMQPYLVQSIKMPQGVVIYEHKPKEEIRIMDTVTAEEVEKMMKLVVTNGTARNVQLPGLEIGGKTGTAENPHGKPHSWFVGFAFIGKEPIALAVIAENAGYGANVAGLIAKNIFEDMR